MHLAQKSEIPTCASTFLPTDMAVPSLLESAKCLGLRLLSGGVPFDLLCMYPVWKANFRNLGHCFDTLIRAMMGDSFKVPRSPKQFSGRFSYSTCTNDFGAATHNERRFQFRLLNHLFRIAPGFMGKSWINRWWSPSELETIIRSSTWAKWIYPQPYLVAAGHL